MNIYVDEAKRILNKRFNDESDEIALYHYTDLDSICSILTNQKLWFSYIRHSNDGNEFILGLNLFIEVYISRKEEFPFFTDEFINFLREEEEPTYKPYILCLSEVGDSLGQWRGYSNFGRGVSVKFKPDFVGDTGRHVLKKVIYNHEEKIKACNELLEDIKILIQLSKRPENIKDDNFFAVLMGLILTLASTFKADTFSEEREWRLIYFPDPTNYNPKIRSRNNQRLVLYCEHNFEINKIETIMLGPDVSRRSISQVTLNELAFCNKYTYKITDSALSFYN